LKVKKRVFCGQKMENFLKKFEMSL